MVVSWAPRGRAREPDVGVPARRAFRLWPYRILCISRGLCSRMVMLRSGTRPVQVSFFPW